MLAFCVCALVVVALTPESPAGTAGNSLTMQCTATLSVIQSTPNFTWTPSTGSAQAITTSSATMHMYSQGYSLGRLRESQDNSDITCRVTLGMLSVVASVTLSVSGKWSLSICMYRRKEQFDRSSSSQCNSKYNGV